MFESTAVGRELLFSGIQPNSVHWVTPTHTKDMEVHKGVTGRGRVMRSEETGDDDRGLGIIT